MLRRRHAIAAAICGGLLVVAGCPVGPLAFGWYSVCSQCGAERISSRSSFLPFIRIHNFEETPFSLAMREAGVVGEHEHDWVFAHGNGPTVSASGRGMRLNGATHSLPPRYFIEATAKWRGTEEARWWLRLVLVARDENLRRLAINTVVLGGPKLLEDRAYYESMRREVEECLDHMQEEWNAPASPG
jgi:hypothetical protein